MIFNKVFMATTIKKTIVNKRYKNTFEDNVLFEKVFGNSPIGMALVSSKGEVIKVNSALLEMFGYSADEFLSKKLKDITYPEDFSKDMTFFKKILAGKIKSYSLEKRYIHKDKHIIWALLSVFLVKEAADKPMFFISYVQDISSAKKNIFDMENQLAELKRINSLMVGREIKMMELKNKIKELENKIK